MKNFFSLLLLVSCFALTAQSEINQKDSQGRKHGLWKKNHANGKLRYEGRFDHGKEVGTFKFYFDNGQIRAINRFRGKTGVCYSYQFGRDSILAAEGKYVNSKRDSIWTFYNVEGKMVSREAYKGDQKEGLSETYFPNGKVAESFNFKGGKKNGEWNQFYDTGRPKAKGAYTDDMLQGEVIYYSLKGKPRAKGKYLKGLMHGNWYYFDEYMKVVKKQVWKYGTMLSQDPPEVKEDDQEGIEPIDQSDAMKWQR